MSAAAQPEDRADFAGLLAVAVLAARMKGGIEDFLAGLPGPVLRRIFHEWGWQAHGGQAEPKGDWRVWLIMAGRGFGKTLAGAQWVMAQARAHPGARIALVGATYDEAIDVMIEGPSGLLALARPDEPMLWERKRRVLTFASGAEARPYSARAAEKLRGPEHDFAWCDELGKWRKGDPAWDNLQMGLRCGEQPRTVITTTPRTVALMRRVRSLRRMVETRGRTADNVHTAEDYRRGMADTYEGSRLGRQELDGEYMEDLEGALWTLETIEKARTATLPRLVRIVVGVDPPASAEGDACGIVVCALGEDGNIYVLADCTVAGERPEGWARHVVRAAQAWEADRVVAEKNNGGEMVESVMRTVEPDLPVRLVHASDGKTARAEPAAARFETGRAKLAGRFPELEAELAGMTYGGGYEGPGRSPDRADAMVWAMKELARPRREPRIRLL
ncbi:MAG TPA: terminase family protein [Allosphingosinicella sp.]|jgi:phage terminase large subunit-like protein